MYTVLFSGLPIACSVSGVSDVKIECGGITPQTSLTCSFNQGPLHPCEIVALFIYFIYILLNIFAGTLPLLLNSDVSPLGKHSVRIVANDSEATVSYSINDGQYISFRTHKILLKQCNYMK